MTEQIVCELLNASLVCDREVDIGDWHSVFCEMKAQTVAAIPYKWLVGHSFPAPAWLEYCYLQKGNWVRVMHAQDIVLSLFAANGIPCVIIKGAAAAMAYPYPDLRSMGDVDVLVARSDFDRAATILANAGFGSGDGVSNTTHHLNYSVEGVAVELHRRIPVVDEEDEELLSLFEGGIRDCEWRETEGHRFPVLKPVLNGAVLLFHINQHIRKGLGLRQVIDWMIFIDRVDDDDRKTLFAFLHETGMEKLARTVTVMCQKYLGLRQIVADEPSLPCDELFRFVMDKGNFGRKVGWEGKLAIVSFYDGNKVNVFRRLQSAGLQHWNAAARHRILRPFAWGYGAFYVFRLMLRNHTGPLHVIRQRNEGKKQRLLIESLGLSVDRRVKRT